MCGLIIPFIKQSIATRNCGLVNSFVARGKSFRRCIVVSSCCITNSPEIYQFKRPTIVSKCLCISNQEWLSWVAPAQGSQDMLKSVLSGAMATSEGSTEGGAASKLTQMAVGRP